MAVYTITLGFGPAKMIRQSFIRYYETRNKELPFTHVLVDQHYPINKEENRKEIAEICKEFGVAIVDPGKNLGLHEGFNWAMRKLEMKPEDIMICFDPDSYPVTPGWDMALVRAILGDPEKRIAWASVTNKSSMGDIIAKGHTVRKSDGFIELWIPNHPIVNFLCAFHVEWLLSVGGLSEPKNFYGHLESHMYSKLGNRQWALLPGWWEDSRLCEMQDWQLFAYKIAHAFYDTWTGDFESFYQAGCPLPLNMPKDATCLKSFPAEHNRKYGY